MRSARYKSKGISTIRRGASTTFKRYHIYRVPSSMTQWFSAQSMEAGALAIPFLNALNYWSHTSWVQLNDLTDMSLLASSPFTAGYKTMQRVYDYMRAYKFKCVFDISFLSSSTTIGPDYFYLCTCPAYGTANPFDVILGPQPRSEFLVETLRKNPLCTLRKVTVNKNDGGNRQKIASASFSLKDLIGVNPAIEINATGVPTDPYSCSTSGTPAGGIFMHLLVLRELQSTTGPQYTITYNVQKNVKVLFFRRTRISVNSGADASV